MEGNSISSFENLCRIFEMHIKLDKEKGINTSIDVLNNYEKYSKKIDAIYNNEFQKELKSLISPGITLEKEQDRLKRLIRLLEERLDKRVELEDRFYESTGKYITGLQMIVSESELNEKKERLSLITNYLDTDREIKNINDSLNKLRDSLLEEEGKRDEYISKNKIIEDELYSTFINDIKNDEYYNDINDEDIDIELEKIRSMVSESKETLDITKESIGSLMTNGLDDDYASYIEEAEKNYYNYKNREIILKIYKLVIKFEDDFKLICSKRDNISQLLDEKNDLRNSLSINTEEELISFEKVLSIQLKTLDNEKEVLENIANYTSRIKFKEERLDELNDINNSSEILVILKEYGLVETYDAYDIEEINEEISEMLPEEITSSLDDISDVAYNPYRIVQVKDYPKTLNIGLAKLKGEGVREKVNKKLNPKETIGFSDLELTIQQDTPSIKSDLTNNEEEDIDNIENQVDKFADYNVESKTPVWEVPAFEEEKNNDDLTISSSSNLPVWESVQPVFDMSNVNVQDEISDLNIVSDNKSNEDSNNMFWIPVSDSKLETKDFPNINISSNNNFSFPKLENSGDNIC